MRDISGRWAVRGREADIGTKIGAGQPLEKFGRAALGDAGSAVDDKVFVQADSVTLVGFDNSATRLSLRMLHTLRCSGTWPATTSSPSRPTHTTLTWGLPSGFKVTRCARAADSKTARALSGSEVMTRR